MANNLVVGNNGVVALASSDGVTFADAGFNTTICANIYEVGNPNKSYVPGREINPITAFVGGKGYYIVMKQAADKTAYLIPPIPGGLTTPTAPNTPVTDDNADNFSWTDAGGKTFADAEYTVNGGTSYANATAKPQPIGNIAKANGQVGIRYKAVAGVSNASATLYNTAPFTVAAEVQNVSALFAGGSGSSLSAYTPDSGAFSSFTGAITLDGSGGAVMPLNSSITKNILAAGSVVARVKWKPIVDANESAGGFIRLAFSNGTNSYITQINTDGGSAGVVSNTLYLINPAGDIVDSAPPVTDSTSSRIINFRNNDADAITSVYEGVDILTTPRGSFVATSVILSAIGTGVVVDEFSVLTV